MRVEESVEIQRPVQEVWQFVADHGNDPKWCRKVKSVEQAGDGRWNVTHKPVPLRPAVLLVLEQLTADPPARLTLRQEDDVSVFNVEYRLDPSPAGTRFAQVSDFEWKTLPRFLHKTFARGVRRDVRGQLRDLKRVLEATPERASPRP
jgi:hypothetical protein